MRLLSTALTLSLLLVASAGFSSPTENRSETTAFVATGAFSVNGWHRGFVRAPFYPRPGFRVIAPVPVIRPYIPAPAYYGPAYYGPTYCAPRVIAPVYYHRPVIYGRAYGRAYGRGYGRRF